jgi:hypothetical protein
MRKLERWFVAAVATVVIGCGGGSKKPAACPMGTTAGKVLPCMCGTKTGTQSCQANMTLTDCVCSGADAGTAGTGGSGSGGSSSGGASGSGGSGGSGGSSSGSGGSGSGGSSASDAGSSGSSGGSTLPMDGNQLSVCTHVQGDCNKGLGCTGYTPPGQGFCTKTCAMDADCMSLSGAKYTCPAGAGLCVISCMNAMDTTSCPSGMTCQAVAAFPGGPGMGMPTFRCKYPSPPDAGMMMTAGTTPEWGKCTAMSMGTSACAMGLTCVGANMSMSRTGFCSKTCTMDSECSTKPGSGTIAPTCVPNGTRGAQTCALPCMPMGTGCPDMMTCVAGTMGAPSYCEYM